ncbi:uncharacterized protein KQ657_000336 [Scheffersomyces spartinae]|uniref:Uncharacterized protein n=1 Tax=Scheffersomyces spartinae TaxID=45513 RepID=A0A9P8AIZ7_9ASCO|nr:uncharacterized protein KQ657_000336 [Scheffersomyces spartinae]KAG7193651.1 hypothetical protein KQ657_000336 [Scheffersomyces spartinae]
MFRRILSIIPITLLALALVALFILNLSGVTTLGLLTHIYFSRVQGALPTQNLNITWYLYRLGFLINGSSTQFTRIKAAIPYSPADNIVSGQIPIFFERNRNTFYYGSRVAYAFLVLALIFTVLAFLSQILSPIFIRVFSPIALALSVAAVITDAVAVALLIGLHGRGVSAWVNDGANAKVGIAAFVLLGVSLLLLIGSTMFSCCVVTTKRKDRDNGVPPQGIPPPGGPQMGGYQYY